MQYKTFFLISMIIACGFVFEHTMIRTKYAPNTTHFYIYAGS